jgi:hypothetical protein
MTLRIAAFFATLLLPVAVPAQTAASPAPATATAPSIDGAWAGVLDLGTAKLHVIFHISTTPAGLTATLDSPDQGATGIATTSTTLTGDTLTITAEALHGTFTGTVAKHHSAITGTWTQGPNTLPLVLTRTP